MLDIQPRAIGFRVIGFGDVLQPAFLDRAAVDGRAGGGEQEGLGAKGFHRDGLHMRDQGLAWYQVRGQALEDADLGRKVAYTCNTPPLSREALYGQTDKAEGREKRG